MKKKEYKKRDKRIRKQILNSSVIASSNLDEYILARYIVEYQSNIQPICNYPYIYLYEYFVLKENFEQGDKGDFIFTNGKNEFLIVEIKYLNPREGKTARTSRNKSRNKLDEQTTKYHNYFKINYPEARIETFTLTNFDFEEQFTNYRAIFLDELNAEDLILYDK